ncbi:MAG TPA: NUDIX domain-containing protein [Candidatus Woesebacteria bacterium]|nr:NUDIX domain-containing protein [Candidatus Woesebacteria bacterium]
MSEKSQKETSAGGIVYKKDEDGFLWLIIQHSKAKHWGFPKGHIGDKIPNEKMEEAALREVQEEGGISAQLINHTPFITHYSYKLYNSLRHKTVYYFLMEYVSGNIKDHDWEVEEALFVPEQEVVKMITYPTDLKAFMEAKEILQKKFNK